MRQLGGVLTQAYQDDQIYPPQRSVFRAFELTPWTRVRVVMVGQDPYHGPGQAEGLAFSVPQPLPPPPSLRNILKELQSDTGTTVLSDGCLEPWARQGVLLLNQVLTVLAGQAASHSGLGWQGFTGQVLESLNRTRDGLVFLLWGKPAQRAGRGLDPDRHLILTAPHPSPLSAYRGFFGSRPFSACNTYLVGRGGQPIRW
ncbi:MAG: uracil-DNA glycosylase [Gammaproteobacteria bacterium]|nr:uracil-DNA glycosylase [Gammaproteobacteria bacterium]